MRVFALCLRAGVRYETQYIANSGALHPRRWLVAPVEVDGPDAARGVRMGDQQEEHSDEATLSDPSSEPVTGLRDDQDPPQTAPPGRPRRQEPQLKVSVELVVVGGEDGKLLRQHQAAAIRKALRWFQENPATQRPGSASDSREPATNGDEVG